jgi:hypothetical protein
VNSGRRAKSVIDRAFFLAPEFIAPAAELFAGRAENPNAIAQGFFSAHEARSCGYRAFFSARAKLSTIVRASCPEKGARRSECGGSGAAAG